MISKYIMVKKKQAKKPLKTKERGKEKSRYKAFKAIFSGEEILSSAKEARDLYSQSNFGEYINAILPSCLSRITVNFPFGEKYKSRAR